jgi:hypothetical protein
LKVWKFPDQVIRLAVLFIVAIVGLIVVRQLLVPKSFGAVGHYRADAVDLSVNRDVKYAGWRVCIECHDVEGEAKSRSYHRTLSCEVCHGPAWAHANAPDEQLPVVPRRRGDSCLYCHSYLASRPTGFPQIIERIHNPLKACIGCHDPHDPTPPETPENCSGCHAEIARTKAISYHAPLECETCHEAAPEHKANPRAFLPKRPTANEFCGQCHARGAESGDEIPRIDLATHAGRYLCWQCHYPHFPEH